MTLTARSPGDVSGGARHIGRVNLAGHQKRREAPDKTAGHALEACTATLGALDIVV